MCCLMRTPILTIGFAGILLLSYIAYSYYQLNRRKRKQRRNRFRDPNDGFHTGDDDSYTDDDFDDEHKISNFDSFVSIKNPRINSIRPNSEMMTSRTLSKRYTDFGDSEYVMTHCDESSEVDYIEDIAGGRLNHGYIVRSNGVRRPAKQQHAVYRDARGRKGQGGDWVVLDDYSLVDGSAEEFSLSDDTSDGINNSSASMVNSQDKLIHDSVVPGSQTIYFRGFGCAHNSSDSEYMMGLLSEYGYKITDNINEADLVVINSCTVKGPSQDAMASEIRKAKEFKIPVVVGGCVPQADRNLSVLKDKSISIIGTTQIDRIVEVVEQAIKGYSVTLLEKKSLPTLDLPKIRQNQLIEIIPLSTGCLGSCTFCKTKHARGVLCSYSMEAILDRVESSVMDGVKQIWLTSEDTGAYGIDLGIDVVTLLRGIVELLPSDVMLRLGMSNPPYIKRHIMEIGKILKHPNVFEFLHLPVQSGSDRVLDAMNREYHVDDFIYLVDKIREIVPNCTIATDIICGFPTETQEEHNETLELLRDLKLPVVNISQFYPRPGTPAAKMKPHENKVAKSRTRDVTQLFLSYECNSKYHGRVLTVWFSEIDHIRHHTIGHTKNYIKVVVDEDLNLLGKYASVYIQSSSKWHLNGKLHASTNEVKVNGHKNK